MPFFGKSRRRAIPRNFEDIRSDVRDSRRRAVNTVRDLRRDLSGRGLVRRVGHAGRNMGEALAQGARSAVTEHRTVTVVTAAALMTAVVVGLSRRRRPRRRH